MSEYMVGVFVGAFLIGASMGLFPLILGLIFERKQLAFGGFAACIVAGFILGIIAAFPTALAFSAS
jgi:hypothetical protein